MLIHEDVLYMYTKSEIEDAKRHLEYGHLKRAKELLNDALDMVDRNAGLADMYMKLAAWQEEQALTRVLDDEDMCSYFDNLEQEEEYEEERFYQWQEQAAQKAPCKGMGVRSGACTGYAPDATCPYWDHGAHLCKVMDM